MNLVSDAPVGLNQLQQWQHARTELAFVYSRSLGGLMQTGRGRIARLAEDSLVLETAGSKLMILLGGARFEAAPQLFFTPDLMSHFGVDGVAVHLSNHDWLFFSEQLIPDGHLAQAATPT